MEDITYIEVLFIDDNEDMCYIAKSLMNKLNMHVDYALSVDDARLLMSKKKYDAIVCDFQMPEENGLVLLKEVRSADSGLPFIMFTGHGNEQSIIDSINNGVSGYVVKSNSSSFIFADLKHKIEATVDAHRVLKLLKQRNIELEKSEEETKMQLEEIKTAQDQVSVYLNKLTESVHLLRISEEKYRKVFESIHEAVCITRLSDGLFISANPTFYVISEYDMGEIIGKTSIDINLWVRIEERNDIIEDLLAGKTVSGVMAHFKTKNGEALCEFSGHIIEISGVKHIISIIRKIA